MNPSSTNPERSGHLDYLLTAYVFDSLSPAGRKEVQEHLAGCAACRAQLSLLIRTLGLAEQALDAGGKEYVFEERRRERLLEAARRHNVAPRLAWNWKLGSVAALLMVAVLVGLLALLAPSLARSRMAAMDSAPAAASKAYAEAEDVYHLRQRGEALAVEDEKPTAGKFINENIENYPVPAPKTPAPSKAAVPESKLELPRTTQSIAVAPPPPPSKPEMPSGGVKSASGKLAFDVNDPDTISGVDVAGKVPAPAAPATTTVTSGTLRSGATQFGAETASGAGTKFERPREPAGPRLDLATLPEPIVNPAEKVDLPKVTANKTLPSQYDGQIALSTLVESFNGDLDTETSKAFGREQAKPLAGLKYTEARDRELENRTELAAVKNSRGLVAAKKEELSREEDDSKSGRKEVAIAAKDDTIRDQQKLIEQERLEIEKLTADFGDVRRIDAPAGTVQERLGDQTQREKYKEQFALNRESASRMNMPHSDYLVYPENWKEIAKRSQRKLGDSHSAEPDSREASDIVVPKDILAKAELGDHFETSNADRPDTQSAFGAQQQQGAIRGLHGQVLDRISEATRETKGVREDWYKQNFGSPEMAQRGTKNQLQLGQTPAPAIVNGPDKTIALGIMGIDESARNAPEPAAAAPKAGGLFPTGGGPGISGNSLEGGGNVGGESLEDLIGVGGGATPDKSATRYSDSTRAELFTLTNINAGDNLGKSLDNLNRVIDPPSVAQRFHWGFVGNNAGVGFNGVPNSSDGAITEYRENLTTRAGNLREKNAGAQSNLQRGQYDLYSDSNINIGGGRVTVDADVFEFLLRGYRHLRAENPKLTWDEFLRRPAPVPAVARTDEGLDEDAYIEKYGTRPFVDCARDHLSTFGLDVDTASYTLARSRLRQNELPDAESVRVEEFLNYFKQPYTVTGQDAFGVFAEGAPSPFASGAAVSGRVGAEARATELLKIGIKSREARADERKPAMLTFVVDTSGSMTHQNRLDLVRAALASLIEKLNPEDAVCIIGFNDQAELFLPRTQARQKRRILDAIAALSTKGGTNVEAGLTMAYRLADESYSPDAVNRVILCSDGVANVGAKGPDEILKLVKVFAGRGIDLCTVGFGMGKYNDQMMVKLADSGNGSCHFVDSRAEAEKIFRDQLPPHLNVLARDAKAQVEFNPDVVERYRLLGYEKRKIADKDFRNDKIDAGEVAHSTLLTVLYEIQRKPTAHGALGKVFLRWKDAGYRHLPVVERNYPLSEGIFAGDVRNASNELRFLACVARFAELLRGSKWVQDGSYAAVLAQLQKLPPEFQARADWIEMRELAARAQELTVKRWAAELRK